MRRIARVLLWALLAVVLLAAGGCMWMTLSPTPAVMMIRRSGVFSAAPSSPVAQALLASGKVAAVRDLDYAPGQGNADTRLDAYWPAGAKTPQPAVVWVHGGGFIDGTKDGMDAYLPQLAAHGYTGIALEYSKAPEQRYPVQVHQVMQALAWTQAHADELHVDPTRIVIGGDSAGAHIAAQVAMAIVDPRYAREAGLAPAIQPSQLRGMLLFSGTYYFLVSPQARVSAQMEKFGRLLRWAYLGQKEPDPDGPARWTTLPEFVDRRFPPTLIVAGNGDPLAPQSRRMATALQAAGVPTEWMYVDGGSDHPQPHEFQFHFGTPEAGQVLDATVQALQRWTRAPAALSASSPAP